MPDCSVIHYITYKFITRPTCQFTSESGVLSSVASCSIDCRLCCGLVIIMTYSSVHNCWILSVTGVTLAIMSIASAAAWALAPNIALRHCPCTCSSNLVPFSGMVAHVAIENSQHGRIRHLYSAIPVFGVNPFLPSINLLIFQAALVALLAAYSACCMKLTWLSNQVQRYLIQLTCSIAVPCKTRFTFPCCFPKSMTGLWVFVIFNCMSHSTDHALNSFRMHNRLSSTVATSFADVNPTKSSANFGWIQIGMSCTYAMNRRAPRIVPADVPYSDSIQSPIKVFTVTRALRLESKLTKYKNKLPDIL